MNTKQRNYYEHVIVNMMNRFAKYINSLVDFSKEYNKTIEDLCRENNCNINDVTISQELADLVKQIESSYDKAKGFYKDLEYMRNQNRSLMDIDYLIRSFNTRVNIAKMIIPANISLQFENETITQKAYVSKTDYSDEFEQLKKDILKDLKDLRKKIHNELDNVEYSEIINKKDELLSDINTLEKDIKDYISQIQELNNNDDDFFQQKSMELDSFNSKIEEMNNKLAQIKTLYGILDKEGLLTGGAANIIPIDEESPTIAGVKQGKPMDPIEARRVNPKNYHNNCQSCVAVFEARIRGYDITVMPKNNETSELMTELSKHPNSIYIDPETGEHPKMERSRVSNAKDCRKWLEEKVKEGERYAFAFSYKGNGDKGHMYVVYRNYKNKLVFYDPQRGNGYNMLHLKDMEYHVDMGDYKIDYSPIIFRIDNTELDIDIMNKISKPH